MDLSLGIFIPDTDLCASADDFSDVLMDPDLDPGDALSFDFEPMDICGADVTNGLTLSSYIDDMPISFDHLDKMDNTPNDPSDFRPIDETTTTTTAETTVCRDIDSKETITTNADTNNNLQMCSKCKSNSDAAFTCEDCSSISKTSSNASSNSGNSGNSSSDIISNTSSNSSNNGSNSSSSSSTASYDSGIGSGDDVTDSSSDAGQNEASKQCTENEATPRRSGRRKCSAKEKDYNLRTTSLINRVEVAKRKATPKAPKPKSKPPPLSKYRRKTANARERTRMSEINEGFEELKTAIPELPKGKLTKITTLHLAMNYISALRKMLGIPDDDFTAYDITGTTDVTSPGGSDVSSAGTGESSSSTTQSTSSEPSDL